MQKRIVLGTEDDDRFDRSRRISWLSLDAVSSAKVLLVGAGALGNEVGKNLALSGFNRIAVIDMDHVVGSNLNRCLFFTKQDSVGKSSKAEAVARGIKALAPESQPEPIKAGIEAMPEEFIGEFDIVFGCLDNIAARLHVNSHAYAFGVPYIDGGMEGMMGRVTLVIPPDGPCLQCGMNLSHAKVAQLRFSCTGKDVVFHQPRFAAEITTTSVISAVMVREALKIVSGEQEMLLSNSLFYDGRRNVSEELEILLDPECPVHGLMAKGYRYAKPI